MIYMHGNSALIFLFCNQCDLLKDMIIVYVFFFKRISFSSSWNFGSNLIHFSLVEKSGFVNNLPYEF